MDNPTIYERTHEVLVNASAPAKAGVAWGGTGIGYLLQKAGLNGWGDFAAMCASIYSLLLIGDWLYKKWKGRRK